MKTILDNCKTLFLDELHYNESLQLIVSEGILLNENQSIKIGEGTIDNVKPIVITENSKKFKIEFDFDDIINFQVIDESYTMFDKNEISDTNGFLQIILKSDYLSYVEKSHGWYKDVVDKEGKHYRLWTESDIIDIISIEKPKIEILEKN
ncbi:hypothetical protein [Tenacibaculum aestuarii]|uniref:hypothetical protein n=1 Tax=Tenacibaculum aestuarii TaxID=362781 RepID=UPI003894D2F8